MNPSLGPAEILVILVVALVVFGPQRLPEIGRQVGRGLQELRRLRETVRDELDEVIHGALDEGDDGDEGPPGGGGPDGGAPVPSGTGPLPGGGALEGGPVPGDGEGPAWRDRRVPVGNGGGVRAPSRLRAPSVTVPARAAGAVVGAPRAPASRPIRAPLPASRPASAAVPGGTRAPSRLRAPTR